MAASLKDLRRRIKSTRQTQKTTRAMEMVSAAKLRRAQGALMAGRPYAEKLQVLLGNLTADPAVASHPLFAPREGNERVLVIFTADRGLCGGFNINLINKAENHLKEHPEFDWKLVCVGRRGNEYFKSRQWPIIKYYPNATTGLADADLTREIADYLLGLYQDGLQGEVWLLFAHYISAAVNKPTLVKYLNLSVEETTGEGKAAEVDYIMEPSREAVLEALLPRYLASRIFITMAENVTSEHSARMLAMNNATKNCDELSEKLTLQMNQARQASITTELLEIVAGAEALKG